MKITMKKLFVLMLAVLMLIPMSILPSFALEVEESISANWNTMAAKYSKGTWKIIAPKSNNYQIRTDGFTFNESADGGIKVTTPDYMTFAGTYGVSAVTSKSTTPLDGLSVLISADKFDSMLDGVGCGNTIGILWTEEKIDSIANFNNTSYSYDKGLYTAEAVYGTGLRTLIPTVEGAAPLTPSFDSKATPNGQALYISVTCDVEQPDAAPVASSVKIAYYDGYYINGDGNPGYRWSFRARNNRNTANSDATRISQNWESIDLSDGLSVSIRADAEHGFIVTVNGYDYYRAEDVGYFPDAYSDWYGYNTNDLTDDGIEELSDVYTKSMTYAKKDVDLTRLTTAGEGYLTVGAISNNDQNLPEHGCNYTVDYINGVPAASWQGEALSEDHVCEMVSLGTKAPTCVRSGGDAFMCKVCGKYAFDNITEPTGHTPEPLNELEKAACDNYGTMASFCSVCQCMVEGYAIPKTPHLFSSEWTGDFTCKTGGTRSNTCDFCSALVTETLEPGHVYEWVEATAATCTTPGTEKQVCTVCGAEGETRETAIDPDAHVSNAWTPVVVDGVWDGLERSVCAACGLSAERTVEVFDYIKHFTDVKQDAWYEDEVAYCVQQGIVSGMSETTFVPNGKLTRAQFLTLLAAVDGVDLDAYAGKNAGFEDVKPSHWFNEEVCWAVENGITSGISETKFGPNNNVTRSQLARFFYVYTEKTGGDVDGRADISAYPDANKVQSWAQEPVQWAVDAGLIAGVNKNGVDYLDPNGNATRAQAARMFMLFTQLGECKHFWTEWEVTEEPTRETEGVQERSCGICGVSEIMVIPVAGSFKLIFDADGDLTTTDDVLKTVGMELGEVYSDIIDELPVSEKEGYIFKGWLNNKRRIVITADNYTFKTFDVYYNTDESIGRPTETLDDVEKTIFLVPIWESEGEKTSSFTFINENVEGFEPIVYGINKDDSYISIFLGEFPDPGVYVIDESLHFLGWYVEEINFLLLEESMWEKYPFGYLTLDGDWVFTAYYVEI